MKKPICNFCEGLSKSYYGADHRFFNAACSKKMVEVRDGKFPMMIEYDACEGIDIERPEWCPKFATYRKDAEYLHNVSSQRSTPHEEHVDELKDKPFGELTYFEKQEVLKSLPPRIKWESIKEDGYYFVPRIMSKGRKLLHVKSKTDKRLECHEVSEYSGKDYSYSTFIDKDDVEMAFLVEIHNF